MLWIILLVGVAVVAFLVLQGKQKAEQRLADSREEAQRWYERLGGQTMNLVADTLDRVLSGFGRCGRAV